MSAFARSFVRRSTVSISAAVLAFGLAGCGQNNAEEEDPGTQQGPNQSTDEDSSATDNEDATETEQSDGGGEDSEGVTQADLDAAGDRFVQFLNAVGNRDFNGVCEMMLDAQTGEPLSSADVETCAQDGERTFRVASDEELQEYANMGTSDVTVSEHGENQIKATIKDEQFPYPMSKADDGQWYVDTSAQV